MRLISLVLGLVLGGLALPSLALSQSPAGHAHNDYEHAQPLLDALAYGFTSVEADVWLVGEDLLIGHDRANLRADLTLQRLYLDPLRAIAATSVAGSSLITLLIDIKTDGEATYRRLSEVLSGYEDILASVRDGVRTVGKVTAVVSGNRPAAVMAAENPRRMFYDGRLTDLESGVSSDFMPLVSDNWTKHFAWTGAGEIPAIELQKLKGIVAKAHAAGYALRFWNTPDNPGPERDALWQVLSDTGVDFINTDDLHGLSRFVSDAR